MQLVFIMVFFCTGSKDYARNGASQRRQNAPRPNYFIAAQVNDPQVIAKAKAIQDSIIGNASRDLSHMTVDVRSSHLTLMAMHLEDSFARHGAIQCLDQCVSRVNGGDDRAEMTLEFEGLGVFNGGSVLYIEVKPSPALQLLTSIADSITTAMEKRGIMAAGHTFNPHMSLLKYSWDKSPKNGAKKIERDAYAMYENDYFGSHTIPSIQLCRMHSERDDGYYVVEHEVFLNK